MFKISAGKEYEDKTNSLFQVNKVLWRFAILQSFIILILIVGYLQLKETVSVTVELPSKIYLDEGVKLKRGINWANKEFFQVWGRGLAHDVSNFTNNNINKKMALVVKMMRPSVALKKDEIIAKYTKAIINNKIKQEFSVLEEKIVDISKSEKQMIYNGIAKQMVGSKKMKPKECKYAFTLKIFNNGVVYVEDIGTDCL